MSNKILHITISIIRNHFRLLKNWLLFENNKIVLLFLLVFAFLVIPPFSVYFNDQSSIKSQIISILLTLIIPVFAAKKYLIFASKEDSMLLVLFNKRDVFITKQWLTLFFTLFIFFLLLSFGIIPHIWNIPVLLLITSEISLFVLFSWFLPYFTLRIHFRLNVLKSNRFWNFQISNVNILPVRGIILREFLSLWRENKKYIIRTLFNTVLINLILILFIINNGKENFFVWALLIQNFIFLTFVINYPTFNNAELMDSMPCKAFYILKGEFVFWLIIFLIYFIFVISAYSIVLSKISILPIVIPFLLFLILLGYVLLVRLAYVENKFIRTLIYIFMFIPITIPFFIYSSYRELKC